MNEHEIRSLLLRAEEIQRQAEIDVADDAEIDQIVAAAEEAGLSREAGLRALQERLRETAPPNVGEMVMAKSHDQRYYPAEVVGILRDQVRVRYLSGGEGTLPSQDLKRLWIGPGLRLEVPWPLWGWYSAEIVAYDPSTGQLTASDGMSQKRFHVSQVRMKRDRGQGVIPMPTWAWTVVAGFAGTGIGALLMWLLTR